MKSVKYTEIKEIQEEIDLYFHQMETSGDYANLDEADFYRGKFTELNQAHKRAK